MLTKIFNPKPMKITRTHHCSKRFKERANSKEVVLHVFEKAINLLKKKKLHYIKPSKKDKNYDD